MFSPSFIFSVLWLSEIFLHVLFADAFYPFDISTWAAIFFCLVFFNFGTLVFDCFHPKTNGVAGIKRARHDADLLAKLFKLFIVVYMIAGASACVNLYWSLQELGGGDLNFPKIREIVIQDFNGDRILYGAFRVFYLGVGFCVFFVACAKDLSRERLAVILAIGLVSALITTGRLYLLMFFLASLTLLYREKLISMRGVILGGGLFAALFFVIALVLGKGEEGGALSLFESVLWNSQVYFMSSVSCFNDFVSSGNQMIEGGALLPNPIRESLSLIGIDIQPKPSLLPFSEVPVPCNTYTFMFPLFHDGSFFGVALGSFVIGGGHQFLFRKFRFTESPAWKYLYAVSLYALCMTIFEDAYFSSPGFWLLLMVPPLLYNFIVTIHMRSVKG